MRKYIIYLKSMTFLLGLIVTIQVKAQSYVTYNHDEAKMNQITVQEIEPDALLPICTIGHFTTVTETQLHRKTN